MFLGELTKGWKRRITPTIQFAILSFIVVGAISAGLILVSSHFVKKDMLDREWGVTADYIRAEIQFHLAQSDFDVPASAAAEEHFRSFYRQVVLMPEIVRIHVYDHTGSIVWSDEPRLIGRKFANAHLMRALTGRTVVAL